jgi:hypothetical protein
MSLPPDPMDWTPEQLMGCISQALQARDFAAIASLLKLLALKDPDSALTIYDTLMALRRPDGLADRPGDH